jgi:hypothetical protein
VSPAIVVVALLATLLVLAAGAALAVAGHRLAEVRDVRERPADHLDQPPQARTVYVLIPTAPAPAPPAPREIPVTVTINPPGSTR